DTTFAIVDRLIEICSTIHSLELGGAGLAAFDAWARQLLAPQLARLGWDPQPGEKDLDAALRGTLGASLGKFGDAAVVAEAQRRFRALASKGEPIPGSLRSAVLGLVGREADAATWEQLRDFARREISTEQKRNFYHALTFVRAPELRDRTLALALTDE